jgi:pilus assembly protein Flp/PilA
MHHLILTLLTGLQGLGERTRRDDEGATAVEYGLMVALIAVVIIGAVQVLGQNTSTKFSKVGSAIGG